MCHYILCGLLMSRPNNVLALEVSAKNGEELFIMRYVSYANFSLPTRLFRWETGPLDDILMPIVHLSCSCRISITYIQKGERTEHQYSGFVQRATDKVTRRTRRELELVNNETFLILLICSDSCKLPRSVVAKR